MPARKRLPRLASLWPLASLGLLACGPGIVEPEEADSRLRTSVVAGGDWQRVDREDFSFLVPPGFEKLALQPIDSDVAAWALGSSSLGYDYGWYTGPWSPEESIDGQPVRDVTRQRVRIGGRTAEMVAFRYGTVHVVRAWWGEVDRSHGQDEHLMLRIETDDRGLREQLLASIYSVQFR